MLRVLLFGPCFLPAVLVLLAVQWSEPERRPPDPTDPDRAALIEGRISSGVEPADGYLYAELTPTRLEQSGVALDYPADLGLYVAWPDASAAPPWSFSDRVRLIAYLHEPNHYAVPGVPDFRELWWRRGIFHAVRLKSARQVERLAPDRDLILPNLFAYRAAFERRLSRLPPEPRRLIRSAFLGDRRQWGPADRSMIRSLGVLHLFVVSGFHVALVIVLASRLLRFAGPWGVIPALALGWAYVMVTGASVAAVRAGVMATLYFGLRGMGLAPGLLNSLGMTTLLLAATAPSSLVSAGFQFCFISLAVIGVMLQPLGILLRAFRRGMSEAFTSVGGVGRRPEDRLRRRVRFGWEAWVEFWPRRLSRASARVLAAIGFHGISLGLGAFLIQLGTLPLALYYSNLLAPAQALHNLALAPAFSGLIAIGLLWFSIFWAPLLGDAVGWAAARWSEAVWHAMLQLDAWTDAVYLPHPGFWAGAGCVAAFFALWWTPGRVPRLLLPAPAALLTVLLAFGSPPLSGKLTITLLDVGQGESIHLEYPDGTQALMDCGGLRMAGDGNDFVGRALVGRYLWNRGVRRLDEIWLSHPHDDHIQGLAFLAPVFAPSRLYYFQSDSRYREMPGERPKRGDRWVRGRVFHEVLHPPDDGSRRGVNDASLVVRLQYGKFSMMLTGDVERRAEWAMLREGLRETTVLKVAHHGAATSSTRAFLEAASPRLAVVSAGRRNPFGHPAPETLERFESLAIPVLNTARHGSIRIVTDGQAWRVSLYDALRGWAPAPAPIPGRIVILDE